MVPRGWSRMSFPAAPPLEVIISPFYLIILTTIVMKFTPSFGWTAVACERVSLVALLAWCRLCSLDPAPGRMETCGQWMHSAQNHVDMDRWCRRGSHDLAFGVVSTRPNLACVVFCCWWRYYTTTDDVRELLLKPRGFNFKFQGPLMLLHCVGMTLQ